MRNTYKKNNQQLTRWIKKKNIINIEKLCGYLLYRYLARDLQFRDDTRYNKEYKKSKGYGEDGVDIVIFRVLNNEKNDIIYKSIYYSEDFFTQLIIHYFGYNSLEWNSESLFYHLYGTYETIIDSALFQSPIQKKERAMLWPPDPSIMIHTDEGRIREWVINFFKNKNWQELTPSGTYNQFAFVMDLDIMTDLFVLAYEKNTLDYMKLLWNSEDFLISKKGWVYDKNIHQYSKANMLNNRVFVVKNVDLFTEKIKAKIKNKGYTLSGPPKPLRHLQHTLDSYLSFIDLDFKFSLINHLQYHIKYTNLLERLEDSETIKNNLSNLTLDVDFSKKIEELNARKW